MDRPLILLVAFQRESRGDLSAVVGRNQRAPLGDLTQLTLREVVNLLKSKGWRRADGRISTAVGGWQFTTTTITDLVERRKVVSWDDKFSEATQWKMALKLLHDRGWRVGISATPELMRSLRLEWEAFKKIPDSVLATLIESPDDTAESYRPLLGWLK